VELGVFLPISGRAAGPEALTRAARQAERLGFAAVWSADRVVTPWQIDTPYPYAEGNAFIVPPDRPFLDSLTCLAYLAGRTRRIKLGISVLVLAYRHPLYWTRVATSLDRLSTGRFVLGVGVGWMEEEFATQGLDFKARGRVTDEQIQIARLLFEQEHASFSGEFYRFEDLAFYPKPAAALPVWVGGEGKAARRRTARLGDVWFPYYVRITAAELARRFEDVQEEARAAGREPNSVSLAVCRPIEVTRRPVEQDPEALRGTPEQLVVALRQYRDAGVSHVALQFTAPRLPERLAQIGDFGRKVIPHFA
jgi:probable F420-dependent oxidoreductase